MKITRVYDNNDIEIKTKDSFVVTIGFFDGIHLGHEKLLEKCCLKATELKAKSLVITFSNEAIMKLKHTYNLCLEENKLLAFEKKHIDEVIVIENDSPILKQTASEFINQFLAKFNIACIYCGDDFCFGCDGKKYDLLDKYYNIEVIESLKDKNGKISSSNIKRMLETNNVEIANSYLFYPYHIKGKVIKGKQLGNTIGFPTANIEINNLVLKDGVYYGEVYYENNFYLAMINVGTNPTTDKDNIKKLEVHILDFNQDIYGKEIEVYFLKYLRAEVKFDSIESLKNQLEHDKLSIERHKIIKFKN